MSQNWTSREWLSFELTLNLSSWLNISSALTIKGNQFWRLEDVSSGSKLAGRSRLRYKQDLGGREGEAEEVDEGEGKFSMAENRVVLVEFSQRMIT